jgi:hypothetical protein
MMDVNAFPAGTPVDQLPPVVACESEDMAGGLTAVIGFHVEVVQSLASVSPSPLNWPCPIFAITDGQNSIVAVLQNFLEGVCELVLIPNGLAVTKPMIRKAHMICMELHLNGIREMLVFVPQGDERMRKRLRRFGFVRIAGEGSDAAVYRVFTSEFLSSAARRRLRKKLS